jgi:hypothetical protein
MIFPSQRLIAFTVDAPNIANTSPIHLLHLAPHFSSSTHIIIPFLSILIPSVA